LINDVNHCASSSSSSSSLTVALGASFTNSTNSTPYPNLVVPSGCALTLNLAGYDLSIASVAAGDAAIAVPTGASLDIEDTSTSTTGTLTATGGAGSGGGGGAGIGGGSSSSSNGGVSPCSCQVLRADFSAGVQAAAGRAVWPAMLVPAR
jgi:hypothetical protein